MIESTQNKLNFVIGQSAVFPFNIRFFRPEDIKCFINEKELVRGVDFIVERKENYDNGANITLLLDELPQGAVLSILRVCDITQDLALPENGKLPSAGMERQLDKLTMIAQQLTEESERAIKVAPGGNSADAEQLANDLLASRSEAAASAASAAESAAKSRVNLSDLRQAIEDALQRAVGMPMGSIFAFPHDVAPGGAEILDGRPVENFPAKYPAFFSFLQNNNLLVPISEWSIDSGLRNYSQFVLYADETTVQMPDLRGAFIEGANENVNTFCEAGLPDISGTWETTVLSSSSIQEGDFSLSGTVSGEKSTVVHFDRLVTAEEGLHYTGRMLEIKGPAPFGKSTTVQPRAARYSWCVWCVPTDLREVDVYTRREIDELLANFKPSGGGSVASVNGQTGEVVLKAADVGAYSAEEAKVLDANLNVLLDAMDSLLGLNVTTLVLYFEESGSYTLRYTMPEGSGYATLQNSETGEVISDISLAAGAEGAVTFDSVPAGVHYLTVGGSMTGLKATTSDGTSPDYNVFQVFAFSQYLTDLEGAFQNCVNLTTFNGAALPGSIVNGDYAFDGCVNLAESLDTLTAGAPEGGYPLTSANYMFRNCPALTGDKEAFIAACPSLAEENRIGMFDGSGGGDPEGPGGGDPEGPGGEDTDVSFGGGDVYSLTSSSEIFNDNCIKLYFEKSEMPLPPYKFACTNLNHTTRVYVESEKPLSGFTYEIEEDDGSYGALGVMTLTGLPSLSEAGEYCVRFNLSSDSLVPAVRFGVFNEIGPFEVMFSLDVNGFLPEKAFKGLKSLRSFRYFSFFNSYQMPEAQSADEMFCDCENLELNLDDVVEIITGSLYLNFNSANRMFYNCAKVTGSRSAFLAKCPYLDSTNTVDMFTGTNTTE